MKKIALCVILIISISGCTQENKQSINNIDVITESIEIFLINEKQISKKNSVKLVIADIVNGKDLREKVKGIFIIRTGTHKPEYLLFRNKEEFDIVKFDNLKLILGHTIKLFNESNDLLIYNKELLKRYEENIPTETKFIAN